MDYVQVTVVMFAYLFFIRNDYDGHTKQGHSLFVFSLTRGFNCETTTIDAIIIIIIIIIIIEFLTLPQLENIHLSWNV
jgi:hypothetical protein